MNKVFLDDLPKKGKYVDWKRCVGLSVGFIYEGMSGFVEILEYNENYYIKLKYKNRIHSMYISGFTSCKLGCLLGKITSDHFHEIGSIIDNVNSGKLEITGKYKDNKKAKIYFYKCLNCGNEDKIREAAISRGAGCNACCIAPRKIVKGINDIHTVDPILGTLLWNHEDGYRYTIMSKKHVDFKCPDCLSKIKNKRISSVSLYGVSCPKCSNTIPYPERLMYNLLFQAGIDFEYQKSFEWSEKKSFDFYIPSLNCIIETHGRQHYEENTLGKRTLDEEKMNDCFKRDMALRHNIRYYIVINCSKSELNYIKGSILNSELATIINLSRINWDSCHELSLKSMIKIACEYFNNDNITANEISEIMKISKPTIIKYLKIGLELGWCAYDPTKESRNGSAKAGVKTRKPIVQLTLNGQFICEYISATVASEKCKVSIENISSVCNGKRKTAGGFRWAYKVDFIDEV
ncbi:hypothetical protein [Paenibacillus cremeus]|uniref:Uncharacterized protein n=1 Tax=Paenibacillus cremeus TaxID=2163881 RepID=A0A559KCS5_9BACL|nr:hypothetical protein [Paenibacillus cremeus]TVY09899.1 hypothetical protein FPZ49_11040 [Paenibacillus cremeus]